MQDTLAKESQVVTKTAVCYGASHREYRQAAV